jgi:hypothetical protein
VYAGEDLKMGRSVLPTTSAADLARIHDPLVELVIWHRVLPPELTAWLASLDISCFPHTRLLITPDEIRHALAAEFQKYATKGGEGRDQFTCDVAELAGRFATLFGTELVDLRIELVTGRACWKFHRDCVPARMLTTYRGKTTQWVSLDDGREALRAQRQFDGEVHRLGKHDVALFKGSASPQGSGIVHRSPPATRRTPRFLLCLNLPSAASPDRWRN